MRDFQIWNIKAISWKEYYQIGQNRGKEWKNNIWK